MSVKKKIFGAATAAIAVLTLAGCGEPQFKVEGEVTGADDIPIVVEKADASGRWIAVDSTRTSSDGSFSIKVAAPGAPEIYRLDYNGNFLYFPIDSVETVKVATTKEGFATAFTLSGSANAEALNRFEKRLNTLQANADASALDAFKRAVYADIIAPAQGSIVSYYVLTKTRDGKPLYDPDSPADAKYFAAVATAYKQFKPNDPRTKLLEEIALRAQRASASAKGKKTVMKANERKFFEIEFSDIDGNKRRLSDQLGKGKPTVLIFTLLTAEGSPMYNAEIRKIHNSGRAEIYMVGLDPDRVDWSEAARNLPWTNVFAPQGDNAQTLIDYNVSAVPTAFIFDSTGELIQREDNPTRIASHL